MQLKDSAEIGQGHLRGGRESRREAQEDTHLVMAQLPSRSRSRVCPGNEGPRGVGGKRVEMGPAKARALVSHLCGCRSHGEWPELRCRGLASQEQRIRGSDQDNS